MFLFFFFFATPRVFCRPHQCQPPDVASVPAPRQKNCSSTSVPAYCCPPRLARPRLSPAAIVSEVFHRLLLLDLLEMHQSPPPVSAATQRYRLRRQLAAHARLATTPLPLRRAHPARRVQHPRPRPERDLKVPESCRLVAVNAPGPKLAVALHVWPSHSSPPHLHRHPAPLQGPYCTVRPHRSRAPACVSPQSIPPPHCPPLRVPHPRRAPLGSRPRPPQSTI